MNTQTNEAEPVNISAPFPTGLMITEIIGSLILISSAAAIYLKGCFQRANEKQNAEIEATEKLIKYQEERIVELEIENRRLRQAMELSGANAPSVTQQRIAEIKETLGVNKNELSY